jgi:SAM-dependent methyltransferase
MSNLVDTTKFPYAPYEDRLHPLLELRQDLLSRLHRAYVSHNTDVDEQDEMWNGLVNGSPAQSMEWQRHHYMYGGRNALKQTIFAMLATDRPPPRSLLDFPSGHGRATRFFAAAFPEAEIWAGDINEPGIHFCAHHFGAKPFLSNVDLKQVKLDRKFDVIWCGSLATHLDEPGVTDLLELLTGALEEDGLLGITTCGRGFAWLHYNIWKSVPDELFEIAQKKFLDRGFGYVNYPAQTQHSCYPGGTNYGMTWIDPAWMYSFVKDREDLTIVSFAEKGWHGSQDCYFFMKRPLSHSYDWFLD